MRPGEVEGIDYFFVDKGTFEGWVSTGQLLEHALVYGEYKGIPRGQVDEALARGADVVLRIDVQVSACVSACMSACVSEWVSCDRWGQQQQSCVAVHPASAASTAYGCCTRCCAGCCHSAAAAAWRCGCVSSRRE